jgi:signal transduction histidine kinase
MVGEARRRLTVFLRRRGDIVLTVVLSALAVADIWTNDYVTGSHPLLTVFTLCSTVPLAFRRRAPLAATLFVSTAVLVQLATASTPHPPDTPFLAWLIMAYSASAHSDLRRALIGGGALILAVDVWVGRSPNHAGTDVSFITIILVGFWFAGRVVRSRNEMAAELAAERDERARFAVAEERARIARELHDVVAHTLSVIVVQAGAERLVQPDGSAHDTLESIERTGRGALSEMGRLLGMLRAADGSAELGPQPSLSRLDELLAGIRETGIDVGLVVEGKPRPLQAGMDVSAYRIVQEALTNSLKHGRCRQARVSLRWTPRQLEIEVADDGTGIVANSTSGHGLLGLRERVALFDGGLVTGRSDLGGFLVAARLPLPGT